MTPNQAHHPPDRQHPEEPYACPKCGGMMRSFERNGVNVEQCVDCQGIFVDIAELEALARLEASLSQYQAPSPPGTTGPGWVTHNGRPYRALGVTGLFFTT